MDFLRNRFFHGKDSRKDKCKDEPNESGIPRIASTPTVSRSSSNIGVDNPFSKYGLPSPPQGESSQDLTDVEKLIKKDKFGKYLKAFKSGKQVDEARCLVFLYGRGFYLEAKKETRRELIKSILKKPEAMERLVRLLESEGADRDITAEKEGLYVRLRQTLHLYFRQEGSFGFLPNQDEATYFFRIQKQGNCFMHAPCVIVAYLLQHRGKEGGAPVDLSKFVRRVFTDEELYKYIERDGGGRGVDVLEKLLSSLLGDTPCTMSMGATAITSKKECFDLEKLLKKHGPGLVTGFACNKHFRNEEGMQNADKIGYHQFRGRHHVHGEFVHLSEGGHDDEEYKQSLKMALETYKSSHNASGRDRGTPQELFPSDDGNTGTVNASTNDRDTGRTKEEYHAMVLIGGRRDKKGNLWLLLQNWWDDMQLVEVDSVYFKGCRAKVTFLRTEGNSFADVNLESFYSMNSSLVADSNNLDRADYDKSDGCFEVPQNDRY